MPMQYRLCVNWLKMRVENRVKTFILSITVTSMNSRRTPRSAHNNRKISTPFHRIRWIKNNTEKYYDGTFFLLTSFHLFAITIWAQRLLSKIFLVFNFVVITSLCSFSQSICISIVNGEASKRDRTPLIRSFWLSIQNYVFIVMLTKIMMALLIGLNNGLLLGTIGSPISFSSVEYRMEF